MLTTERSLPFWYFCRAFCVLGIVVSSLYAFHRGFRRTCQFWAQALPWIVEYHVIKFHAFHIAKLNETSWQHRSEAGHRSVAPQAVEMVARMGGIYVKIGQALSTMGSGILPEEYVQALRPLQDGIPPRSYATISAIIEESTGQKMEDIFEWFEETPVGAATIAQAHRAVLKPPSVNAAKLSTRTTAQRRRNQASSTSILKRIEQEQDVVIVKVQYPEVAELFDADLNNLELLVKIVMPGRSHDQLQNTRKRHEQEMDFHKEAAHLEECARNMVQHGMQPRYVRIPRVRNETGLCTKNVLVMEYLDGIPLREVMNLEQDRIARALGKQSGEELQYLIAKRIKAHIEGGGGDAQMRLLGGGGGGDKLASLWSALGPFAIHVLRHYARLRERIGMLAPRLIRSGSNRSNTTTTGLVSVGKKHSTVHHKVNLGRVLKTLIRATGIQIMHDGIYNLDPRPGNVLVLRDGRTVGLLDYGMVGRISENERRDVATTVTALARNDPQTVASLYLDSGYHIELDDKIVTDPNILFRMASSHMDKIDLSPITLTKENVDKTKNNSSSRAQPKPKGGKLVCLN